MGVWGTGLFDDDTACDVRDTFIDSIASGMSPEVATLELMRSWGSPSFDPDEETVFWVALAATQSRLGRLLPHVRDRAIDVIDSGADCERFADDGMLREKRAQVLAKLKILLLGAQRKPQRVKLPPRHENSWRLGAILACRLSSGRLSMWRVVDHHVDQGGRFAVVEVLRGTFGDVPSELTLALRPGVRERTQQRYFRIIVSPEYEASHQLTLTDRGTSAIAKIMMAARQDRTAVAGAYLEVFPVKSGIDKLLADTVDLD